MNSAIKTHPLWWEGTAIAARHSDPLPARVDALVIGSGFTGSSAALELGRRGWSVALIDSHELGFGSSSRNFGYLGGGIGTPRLAKRHKGARGERIAEAYPLAGQHVLGIIEREGIACDIRNEGLAVLAHTPEIFEHLKADVAGPRGQASGAVAIPRDELRERLIASDRFHGGIHIPGGNALNPGKYIEGLIAATRRYGVAAVANAEALAISGGPGQWRVRTTQGEVIAKHIALGTNGHSGKLFPFLRRRIVPVVGTVIATERLGTERIRALFPKLSWFSDTQYGFLCFRPSPDHERVIFAKAGLPGSFADPARYAAAVHKEMVATLPDLADVRLDYAWPGAVGVTFDAVPHMGIENGIHYAAGYNGSGVTMASYLGHMMGCRIAGDTFDQLVFEQHAFPGHWAYRGYPWFMPAMRVLVNYLKLPV